MPSHRRWPVAAEAVDIVMRQQGCDAATAASVIQRIAARDKLTLHEVSAAIVAHERAANRDDDGPPGPGR